MIHKDQSGNGNTLAELIALRMTVRGVCQPCNHHRALDLAALRSRFGSETRIGRIRGALVCSECGRRATGVIVTPPT